MSNHRLYSIVFILSQSLTIYQMQLLISSFSDFYWEMADSGKNEKERY